MSEKEGNLTPEIVKLTEKMSRDPSSKLFVPLAEEYMKCGMREEALMVLTDGIKIHPHYVGAHVSLGKLYWLEGKKEEAKKEFEQVILANPENILAHRYLIQVYREEGQWERALNSCRLILSFNPKDSDMLTLRDELEKKNSKKAVEVEEKRGPTSSAVLDKEPLLETTSITQPEPGPPSAQVSASEGVMVSEDESPKDELKPSETATVPREPSQSQTSAMVESISSPTAENGEEMRAEKSDAPPPDLESRIPPGPALPIDEPNREDLQMSDTVEQVGKDSVLEEAQPPIAESVEEVVLPEPSQDDSVIEIPEDHEDDLKSLEAAFSSSTEIDFTAEENSVSPQETARPMQEPSKAEEEKLKSKAPLFENGEKIPKSSSNRAVGEPGGGASIEQEDFASESLAELYVRQGFYKKGIDIYHRLISSNPNNKGLKQKLNDAVTLAKLLTGFDEGDVEGSNRKEESIPPLPQQDNNFSEDRYEESALDSASLPMKQSVNKEDPKSQKIQRLQAWLDNIKKGQSS